LFHGVLRNFDTFGECKKLSLHTSDFSLELIPSTIHQQLHHFLFLSLFSNLELTCELMRSNRAVGQSVMQQNRFVWQPSIVD